MPFDPFDRESLLLHFEKHGADFGVETPEEYEAFADRFMDEPRRDGTKQCIRASPVPPIACRYSTVTEEYGVKRETAYLITYFILDLEDHLFETNLEYYQHHCK